MQCESYNYCLSCMPVQDIQCCAIVGWNKKKERGGEMKKENYMKLLHRYSHTKQLIDIRGNYEKIPSPGYTYK